MPGLTGDYGDIGPDGPQGPKGEKGAGGEFGSIGEKGYRVSYQIRISPIKFDLKTTKIRAKFLMLISRSCGCTL